MWKLYLKSDEGVAISTTCDRLCRCFRPGTTYDIFIGAVQYRNRKRHKFNSDGNMLTPFFIKGTAFSHEKEVRAVVSPILQEPTRPTVSLEPEPPNKIAPLIDVELLIKDVYVAPGTPDWVKDAVQSVIDKFNLKRKVRRSSLSESPVF
jgi:hypothetical protein